MSHEGTSFNHEMLWIARDSRGLTQEELARKVQVAPVQILKVEGGVQEPTEDLVETFSRVLEYPVAFFYQVGHYMPLPYWFWNHIGVRGEGAKP